MDDLSFRAEFRRALAPVTPPAPWLSVAVRDRLRERREKERRGRRMLQPLARPTWLLPAVAVLLAIAIVVALVLGARALQRQQTIPVQPPHRGLGGSGCPGWGNGNGSVPPPDRMTSVTVGWSAGALRTTDGGAHWQHVAPAAMSVDAPSGSDLFSYPPAYTDFFLDSSHAWIARSYASAGTCFDHVSVFSTSDGGVTWHQSNPVTAAVRADTSLQLELDFLDAQHGWLMVLGGGRIAPDSFLYSTADGGRDWRLVSQMPLTYSFCTVDFVTPTTGFLGGCSYSGGLTATLVATFDGGKTWSSVRLPEPRGSQFSVAAPVFFDPDRGIVRVTDQLSGTDYLATTADGGKTWTALVSSAPGFAVSYDFIDASTFWVLAGDGKGTSNQLFRTTDAGATWTLFNSDLPMTDLSTIQFIDAQHGFILARGQQLGQGPSAFFVTTDGGHTWHEIHPQVS